MWGGGGGEGGEGGRWAGGEGGEERHGGRWGKAEGAGWPQEQVTPCMYHWESGTPNSNRRVYNNCKP